jgi:hypothetical protein
MMRVLWQQKQDIGPAARVAAAMVYNASTARTLLWGGYDVFAGIRFGDTWEWDGEGWVQVADTGPAPTAFAGLAFDSVRNVAVLFTSNEPNAGPWETWEWDGQGWTQVDDTGPQAANAFFQLVYDRARNVTLLEGGAVQSGSAVSPPVGTWSWDGTTWTQLADMGPPQRVLTALAYDASRRRVVHFGGQNYDGTYGRDTWEWDGSAWEQVENIGPVARYGHGLTGTAGATLLFGGIALDTTPLEPLRDTWTWDGNHWQQRQDMGPSPRGWFPMTWDMARTRGVLFGGYTMLGGQGNQLGDTWEVFEVG